MSDYQHTPGSAQAVVDGCLCPTMDNRHGRGAYVDRKGFPVFWYNADCPLHGRPANPCAPDEILYKGDFD